MEHQHLLDTMEVATDQVATLKNGENATIRTRETATVKSRGCKEASQGSIRGNKLQDPRACHSKGHKSPIRGPTVEERMAKATSIVIGTVRKASDTNGTRTGVGKGRVAGVMHRNRGRVHSIQKTFLPFHQDGKGKRHVRLSHTASRKRHTRKGEVRMMPTSEPDVWRVKGWEVAKGCPWKGTRDQCRAKEHT